MYHRQEDFDAAARRAELIDTTGDGLPDTLAIDTNDDGKHDTMIKLERAAGTEGSQDIMQRIKLVDTVGDGCATAHAPPHTPTPAYARSCRATILVLQEARTCKLTSVGYLCHLHTQAPRLVCRGHGRRRCA